MHIFLFQVVWFELIWPWLSWLRLHILWVGLQHEFWKKYKFVSHWRWFHVVYQQFLLGQKENYNTVDNNKLRPSFWIDRWLCCLYLELTRLSSWKLWVFQVQYSHHQLNLLNNWGEKDERRRRANNSWRRHDWHEQLSVEKKSLQLFIHWRQVFVVHTEALLLLQKASVLQEAWETLQATKIGWRVACKRNWLLQVFEAPSYIPFHDKDRCEKVPAQPGTLFQEVSVPRARRWLKEEPAWHLTPRWYSSIPAREPRRSLEIGKQERSPNWECWITVWRERKPVGLGYPVWNHRFPRADFCWP